MIITKINQIKYGSIISYALIAINIVLGLIYTPWILEVIGDSEYGLYTLASSFIALFLLDFGMGAAVTRFISNFRAENNQKAINAFASLAIKFYIAVCAIIGIIMTIVYFNIDTIYSNLTSSELESFKIVFILTASFVVICFPVNVFNGILNAHEQYVYSKISDVFNKLGTVVVTIIALICGGGLYSLVAIHGIFSLITMVVKLIFVLKKTPVKLFTKEKSDISVKEIVSFSLWSTIQTLSSQMIFNLIPSVLAMVANTFAITLYGFAKVIEGYTFNITQAINGLFLPKISRTVVGEKNAEKTLPLMIKVGRINQSIISLLIIGIAVLGKDFVSLWVGNEYKDLYYCILLLIFPYFFSASQQIANTSIIVLNKVKYQAIINLCVGILNLVFCYFIAPQYGVIGVCVITCIFLLLRTAVLNVVFSVVLKIKIGLFFKECHIKMLPGLLLSLVLSYAVNYLISATPFNGWLVFIIKAGLIGLIYFTTLWIITWNRFEKDLLLSFIKKLKK